MVKFKHIFGLRGKVALRESFIVVLASTLTFIPLEFNNVNVLILVPVFCTIISCNISSFSSLISGCVVVLATCISSILIHIYSKIFDKIWPSWIITFFFTFIMYSYVMRGGRWINSLAVKKTVLDIIISHYFSVSETKREIYEIIIGSLFILGSITVSAILFPSLATRLFRKKIKKSLLSTRSLFRGVGYSIENKLYNTFTHSHSVNNIYQNQNQNQNNYTEFNNIDSNPLKQFHTLPNNDNNKDNKLTKNTSFVFPLVDLSGDIIDDLSNGKDTLDENKMIEDYLEIEKSKSLSSSPNQNKLIVGNNEIGKLPLTRSSVNDGKDPIQVTIPTLSQSSSTNINKDINHGSIEMETLKNPNHSLILKKKKPVSMLSTAVPLPSEEELKLLQLKLTSQINRLTLIFGECKQERWNLSLTDTYKSLLTLLDGLLNQLISLRISIEYGFSKHASQELLLPCLPFLDSIVEEVYLQIGLMIEILEVPIVKSSKYKERVTTSKSILENSFEETSDLVYRLQDFYKQLVFEYQRGGFPTLQQSEICRIHFFIYGIIEFTSQQRDLLNIVLSIREHSRKVHIRLELIRFGFNYIITSLPLHYFKVLKQTMNNIKSYWKNERNWYQDIIEYFDILLFRNGKWKFPFQVSIGLVSSLIIFFYFNGQSKDQLVIRGVWTCATVILVMSPSVGASINKGIHRVIGTMLGGVIGFLVSWASNQITPAGGKEVVILAFTFIWISMNSFIQQDPRYSYAGSVSGLTFILIVNGQYLTKESDIWYAINRSFHIALGVIWVVIICFTVFPYYSYINTKTRLISNSIQMSKSFIDIIKISLKLEDNSNSNDISIPIQNLNGDGGASNNNLNNNINREKKTKEIRSSIKNIRMNLDSIKVSLLDVKSELLFSPKISEEYHQVYHILNNSYTRLVASENSLLKVEFSDQILEAMLEINEPLSNIFQSLKLIEIDLVTKKKKSKGNWCIWIPCKRKRKITTTTITIPQEKQEQLDLVLNLMDSLKGLSESFQVVRMDLLKRKLLASLHPEMITFGSAMFNIHDFIKHYSNLFNHLQMITNKI